MLSACYWRAHAPYSRTAMSAAIDAVQNIIQQREGSEATFAFRTVYGVIFSLMPLSRQAMPHAILPSRLPPLTGRPRPTVRPSARMRPVVMFVIVQIEFPRPYPPARLQPPLMKRSKNRIKGTQRRCSVPQAEGRIRWRARAPSAEETDIQRSV